MTRRWMILALLASGCSLFSAPDVTPTRYFVLTSDRSLRVGTPDSNGISLGLGPFSFPSYLSRPQMVTRTDPNQIVFSQFNRWAEPVEAGFQRVLAENVGAAVGTNEVVMFPWYEIPLEYQVKGEVLRFEANDDGEVVLEVIWTVLQLKTKQYLVTKHSDLRRPVNASDTDQVAAELSALASDLGNQIGETLRTQHARQRR